MASLFILETLMYSHVTHFSRKTIKPRLVEQVLRIIKRLGIFRLMSYSKSKILTKRRMFKHQIKRIRSEKIQTDYVQMQLFKALMLIGNKACAIHVILWMKSNSWVEAMQIPFKTKCKTWISRCVFKQLMVRILVRFLWREAIIVLASVEYLNLKVIR